MTKLFFHFNTKDDELFPIIDIAFAIIALR